jgi:hypothetical protein
MGWQVERLSSWRAPRHLRASQPVLYGEPLFAAVVADTLDLVILEPPFSWIADIPYEYRLRRIEYTDLGKARNQTQRAFIKPADDKCFPARVYDSGLDLPSLEILSASTPVLISEPVHWEVEFRCFVQDRRVTTHSAYSRNGELAQGEDGDWPATSSEIDGALQFIGSVLADSRVELPSSVVVDVGIISDRGWAVVEANASWASGIYGCEGAKVLEVLAGAVKKKEDLTEADKRWINVRNETAA